MQGSREAAGSLRTGKESVWEVSISGFAAKGKSGNHMVTVTLAELTAQTGPLFTCPTANPNVNPAHR